MADKQRTRRECLKVASAAGVMLGIAGCVGSGSNLLSTSPFSRIERVGNNIVIEFTEGDHEDIDTIELRPPERDAISVDYSGDSTVEIPLGNPVIVPPGESTIVAVNSFGESVGQQSLTLEGEVSISRWGQVKDLGVDTDGEEHHQTTGLHVDVTNHGPLPASPRNISITLPGETSEAVGFSSNRREHLFVSTFSGVMEAGETWSRQFMIEYVPDMMDKPTKEELGGDHDRDIVVEWADGRESRVPIVIQNKGDLSYVSEGFGGMYIFKELEIKRRDE